MQKVVVLDNDIKGYTFPMALLKEFKEFAVRGNAVDMMVGIVVGAGFINVVNSFVKDVLMPPISLLTGPTSLQSRYLLLSGGKYDSLEAAEKAGAVVVKYGLFLNHLIDFLVIAFVVFLFVRTINRLRREEEAPIKKKKKK